MKKPKPPKSIKEVRDYIRLKKLNVNWVIFWDYFEASGWYDSTGKPVLNWKQKLITWHGRDKRTIAQAKEEKLKECQQEINKQRIREEHEQYLRNKSTQALHDIKADGGYLSYMTGWLIDEILAERRNGGIE